MQCPSDTGTVSATPQNAGYNDYWINYAVGGENEASFAFISNTLLNGDGIGAGANAEGNYSTAAYSTLYYYTTTPTPITNNSLKKWITQVYNSGNAALTGVGAGKHLEGANYSFADGHVKWLLPGKISDATPASDVSTFPVK